uniref:(northern house mosquito) hypothetical protein n=1 Tax=Culex pipiens TaxID=7175 RepID=A0A8D8BNY0_CULPI
MILGAQIPNMSFFSLGSFFLIYKNGILGALGLPEGALYLFQGGAAQIGNLANLQNAKFLLGPAEGAKLFKEGDLFVKELVRRRLTYSSALLFISSGIQPVDFFSKLTILRQFGHYP